MPSRSQDHEYSRSTSNIVVAQSLASVAAASVAPTHLDKERSSLWVEVRRVTESLEDPHSMKGDEYARAHEEAHQHGLELEEAGLMTTSQGAFR